VAGDCAPAAERRWRLCDLDGDGAPNSAQRKYGRGPRTGTRAAMAVGVKDRL
jgi:hypothetical protein